MVLRKRHPCVSWRLDRENVEAFGRFTGKAGWWQSGYEKYGTNYRYNNAQHTHIYIYICIYIQYVNIGTYMHMYLYIYIYMQMYRYSFGYVRFCEKNIPQNHGPSSAMRRYHLEELYSNGMAATTLRGHKGVESSKIRVFGILESLFKLIRLTILLWGIFMNMIYNFSQVYHN